MTEEQSFFHHPLSNGAKTLIVSTVVLALLFAGTVTLSAISRNNDTAVSAKNLAVQIQRERVRNIRANCQDINERHDNTIAALDELISKVPPERKMEAKQSRDSTVLLINSLTPKRNCEALVKRQAPGG